ncbi:MAG: amino acid ABC transporter substrate-binding protein, partial [bacterium]|nr:amino acid ABC transporter substrate-binding protein [bacterium]
MHLVAYPSCKSLPAAFERHRVVIPALLSLCLLLTAGSRTAHAQDRARPIVPPLTLGALYGNTPTGLRYLQGIKDAVAEHAIGSQVTIVRFPYANEAQGLDLLTEILTEKKADIVIGPTESGVFVNALKHGSELQKYEIPVISSLVTADIPHREFGWFFRTNSDVRRRSHAIFDFLNKYWVRSIALLYANTEFGRRAEEAFLRQLSSSQKERYLPLLYHSPPIEARNQIRQILATRPEAVGIIGEREDIRDIYESIERMNSWGDPYTPIFFTIVDVSLAGGHLNNFYFVS